MKKIEDHEKINPLCLACAGKCKQLANCRIIRCKAFKAKEENKDEN